MGARTASASGAGAGAGEAAARLVLAAVLLHSLVQCAGANTENNARLTTGFGKPKQPAENHPPKELTGRLCNTSNHCESLHNTTCLTDPRDGKHRCLCGDRTVPINGICRNKYRIIRFPCSADMECTENSECQTVGNIIANMSMNAAELKLPPNASNNMKFCWCKEGFQETYDGDHCGNIGSTILPSGTLLFITIFALINKV